MIPAAHISERLPPPPQALEEPAPWVRHYGFGPREGETALEELSQDQKDKECMFLRQRLETGHIGPDFLTDKSVWPFWPAQCFKK